VPVVPFRPVVRPGFPSRTVIVTSPVVTSRTVIVGGGFFLGWPYYYPPYYPPYYYPPGYAADSPAYVEQGADVRYYCPDYRDYYPNVPDCPSPWMKVVP
jgi:hypothetical protein